MLTLTDISGIVLTLIMVVDANISFYERVKEELYNGKVLSRVIDKSYSFKGGIVNHLWTVDYISDRDYLVYIWKRADPGF